MRLIVLLVLFLLIGASAPSDAAAQADDIPDNCEYLYGEFYRPSVFPRYEPQNRRLLLVDWTTSAEVATLGTNLDDTLIRAWSADCRYLAVATGSIESRATAVYDTIDARYIGEVPDARTNPHPLTWGVHDFLMVETRNGAVLWNVPQNIQYPLETGFNTTSYRNFSRLRWDGENYQVTGNLAVGGRIVVDLRTGQQTIAASSSPGEIVLGGERFPCAPTYSVRGGARVGGYNYGYVDLHYASSGGVISVARGDESLLTLEGDLPQTGLQTLGWSINCRYVAGALGSTELIDAYDTVIWDVLEGRRVATIPDARDTTHRLTWDTAEKHVLVETRDGAYLWDLETNTGIRVEAGVIAPPFNCDSGYNTPPCRHISFHGVDWDAGRQQMLGVPVDTPDSIVAFDVATGQEVTRYTVEGAPVPLDFITSPDSRYLLANANGLRWLLDRTTSAMTPFASNSVTTSAYYGSSNYAAAAFSTDSRFLATTSSNHKLRVWDLTTTLPDAAPTYRYDIDLDIDRFVNGDTLQFASYYGTRRFNVVTGDRIGDGWYTPGQMLDSAAQPVQTYTAIPGTTGFGIYGDASQPQCPVAVRYDSDLRQIIARDLNTDAEHVVAADVNRLLNLYLSPDCRVVYARVYTFNDSIPYLEADDRTSSYSRPNDLFFWDAATGAEIGIIPNIGRGKFDRNNVSWNPDGSRALIHAIGAGDFLLQNDTQTLTPVQFTGTTRGSLPSDLFSYWDHQRGVVLVAGWGEVFAIDMQTGTERLRFPALETGSGGCYEVSRLNEGCGMTLSPDGKWVFVYGDHSMSAWNIDTLANATVPVDTPNRGERGGLVSPDGRYLIVSRSAVRVWDLANLPEAFEDRQPIATFGVGNRAVLSLTLVDNTTIEVITRADGVSGTVTTRYDVRTGEII